MEKGLQGSAIGPRVQEGEHRVSFQVTIPLFGTPKHIEDAEAGLLRILRLHYGSNVQLELLNDEVL